MTQFSAGQIVRLKSGGPKMVVINAVEKGFYCQYFDYLGQCHSSYFLTENLVPESIND